MSEHKGDVVTTADHLPPTAGSVSRALSIPQTARSRINIADRVIVDAEVKTTPLGLLAVGGLVTAILLSVPPIIRAARKPGR